MHTHMYTYLCVSVRTILTVNVDFVNQIYIMNLGFCDRLSYHPAIILASQLSIGKHLLLPDHLVAVCLEHEVAGWTSPQV